MAKVQKLRLHDCDFLYDFLNCTTLAGALETLTTYNRRNRIWNGISFEQSVQFLQAHANLEEVVLETYTSNYDDLSESDERQVVVALKGLTKLTKLRTRFKFNDGYTWDFHALVEACPLIKEYGQSI